MKWAGHTAPRPKGRPSSGPVWWLEQCSRFQGGACAQRERECASRSGHMIYTFPPSDLERADPWRLDYHVVFYWGEIHITILAIFNSLVFSTFGMVFSYHLYLVPKHPVTTHHFPLPQPPQSLAITSLLSDCGFACYGHFTSMEFIQYVVFCIWLLWLSMMFLRPLHTVMWVTASFLWQNNIPFYGYIV